jgi:hypothetical protein
LLQYMNRFLQQNILFVVRTNLHMFVCLSLLRRGRSSPTKFALRRNAQ